MIRARPGEYKPRPDPSSPGTSSREKGTAYLFLGLYGWCFIGMAPFGSLLVVVLAEERFLGIPWTLVLSGALCLVVVALVARGLFRSGAK